MHQGLFKKADRLSQVCQFLLLRVQPLLVDRIPAHKMFAKNPSRPLAELGAALGIYPVADGQDGVQIVELYLVGFTVLRSLCKFCTNCLLIPILLIERRCGDVL